jgi:parvulin-like peptidyl-prolyl isomerase
VTVKPTAVDAAVKQTLSSAFPGSKAGSADQAKVEAEFKRTGMTRALLRHRIETKLLAQAAASKVGGSPTVTDAQVTARYEKDKATVYALPERRKVRHILVKTKALADQVYAQLSSSDALFAELAKRYSTDSTKTSGGDLGVVNRTGLVKPFADVAFTIAQGVVSPPTKTQFGWHLIEAEGPVLPKSTRPLDKALKAQIRSQLVQTQRQKHVARQFDAAVIQLSKKIQFAPGYAPAIAATQ